jgi:hypothetical protein
VAGCGNLKGAQQDVRPDRKAAKAALPEGIQGEGWHIPWRMADPKHPNGPPITVLIADARTGSMNSEGDNILVRLHDVHAQLFHAGKRAAYVTADNVTTNKNTRVVIGTGGVKVTSLTAPPDTVITADRMTWDPHTNKVIALGNAHARQTKPAGQAALDTYAPRMEYDLATGRLSEE